VKKPSPETDSPVNQAPGEERRQAPPVRRPSPRVSRGTKGRTQEPPAIDDTSDDWPDSRRGASTNREEQIRLRAYYLSLERGTNPGSAVEDWIRAEREFALV
jgi:hypothetical protein